MSNLKKIILSVSLASFTIVSLLSPFVQAAHAQATASTWYFPDYQEWYARVMDQNNEDEIFGERYTMAQVVWILYSLITFILDGMGNRNLTLCVLRNADNPAALVTECKPAVDNLVSYLPQKYDNNSVLAFIMPNNTIKYFQSIGHKLKLVPEARAQAGFGFEEALNPVQRLWTLVRNLTYFLLIVATVVVSFMIMFRVKISPQTVISVQSAIPKIIVALILITFSYAIAGFLIDLMYVVIGLISSIIASSGLVTGVDASFGAVFTNLTSRTALSLMMGFFVAFIVIGLLALFSNAIGIIALLGIGAAAGVATGATLLILLIVVIIILIVLLILAFRIWFMLLRAFVSVLLLTIIAPIQILTGVFGFGGFGAWVRNYLANLAVFPTAGVMFFVAFIFLAAAIPASIEGLGLNRLMPFNPDPNILGPTTWIPPLTWGSSDPDILWLAVAVVIISLIPRTAEVIRGLISGRPFAAGTAIGEAVGPARTIGRAGATLGVSRWLERRIATERDDWLTRGVSTLTGVRPPSS